jgi:hypothetical protein
MSDTERAAFQAHAAWLRQLLAGGVLITAGRYLAIDSKGLVVVGGQCAHDRRSGRLSGSDSPGWSLCITNIRSGPAVAAIVLRLSRHSGSDLDLGQDAPAADTHREVQDVRVGAHRAGHAAEGSDARRGPLDRDACLPRREAWALEALGPRCCAAQADRARAGVVLCQAETEPLRAPVTEQAVALVRVCTRTPVALITGVRVAAVGGSEAAAVSATLAGLMAPERARSLHARIGRGVRGAVRTIHRRRCVCASSARRIQRRRCACASWLCRR